MELHNILAWALFVFTLVSQMLATRHLIFDSHHLAGIHCIIALALQQDCAQILMAVGGGGENEILPYLGLPPPTNQIFERKVCISAQSN